MRLAIIGSREISDPRILLEALKEIPCLGAITEIVSGRKMDIERDLTATIVSFDLKSLLPNRQKSSVKSTVESSAKTADKIKGLMKTEPEISLSQIAETLGLTTRAIEKSVRKMRLNDRVL